MKQVMKTLAALATVVMAAVMLTGCIINGRGIDGDNAVLTLRLTAPGGFTAPALTRALSREQENTITAVYMLVFDDANTLTWKGVGAVTTNPATTQDNTGVFKISIPQAEGTHTLVVLANTVNTTGIDALTVNTSTYTDAVEDLVFSTTSKLYARGGAIPMWGEKGNVSLSAGAQTLDFKLTRAVARVDVGVGTPSRNESDGSYTWDGKVGAATIHFQLKSVHVFKPNGSYTMMPDPANLDAQGVPTAPTVPGANTVSTYPWQYGPFASTLYSTRDIYLPEADVKMAGGSNHANRMAVVIGGRWDEDEDGDYDEHAQGYYRADFVQDGKLTDILRNCLYLVSVTGVTGRGQDDPDAAYARVEPSYMTVEVLEWNEKRMDGVGLTGPAPIAVTQSAGGTITASHDEATRGTTVTLTAEPGENMVFAGWVLGGATITPTPDPSENPLTFNMPAGRVTVAANFNTKMRTIAVYANPPAGAGGALPTPDPALPGTPVSLTAPAPATYYEFAGWELSGGLTLAGGSNPVGSQTITVSMPAHNDGVATANYELRWKPIANPNSLGNILIFEGEGDDTYLTLGTWGVEINKDNVYAKMAFFKWGSVVGMNNVSTDTNFNSDIATANNAVRFNPQTAAIAAYADIKQTTTTTIANPITLSGVQAGEGDPCQLIGLTAAEIKGFTTALQFQAALDARPASYKGWRMPSQSENVAVVGSSYTLSSGNSEANPGTLTLHDSGPVVLPLTGRRIPGASQNNGTEGWYWSSSSNSVMPYTLNTSGNQVWNSANDIRVCGIAIRCVHTP